MTQKVSIIVVKKPFIKEYWKDELKHKTDLEEYAEKIQICGP